MGCMDFIKLISNHVRLQVIQYLSVNGEATTKQISEALPQIPPATIYRHINILLKEEVLLIKDERRVRGSVERLLAVNISKIVEAGDRDGIVSSSYQFLMELFAKFYRYGSQTDANPQKDMLMLRICMLSLSDEDFGQCIMEIGNIIQKYMEYPDSTDAKSRCLSIISAPAVDGMEVQKNGE